MRNRVVNQHVLKAISIGLAAFIATSTPLTALANESGETNSDSGSGSGSESDSGSGSGSGSSSSSSSSSDSGNSSESTSYSRSANSGSESSEPKTSKQPDYRGADSDGKNAPKDSGIDNTDAKYNNVEGSAPSADGSTTEKLESSKKMEASADAAEKAAEEAVDALNEVLEEAGKAASEVDAANDAADKAEKANGAAEEAVKKAEDTAKNASQTKDFLKEDVNEYNDDVEKAQGEIDAAGETIDLSETAEGEEESELAQKLDKLDEDKEKAEALKEAALEGLEKTLEADGEERKEAAAEVQKAAEAADVLCWQAGEDLKAAEDTLNAAIDEYNKKAMLYGLPLYGTDEDGNPYTEENPGYDDAKLIELGLKEQADAIKAEKATMETEYEAIQKADVSDSAAAIESAQKTYKTAETAYDAAKDAAADAKEAAEAAQEAVEKAAAIAEQKQDETLNYYVKNAQAEVDAVEERITSNSDALQEALQKEAAAQSAYNTAAATAGKTAEDQYNQELNRKKETMNSQYSKYLDAQNAYDHCKWWEKGSKWYKLQQAKDDYSDAKKVYDSYNTAATKNNLIKAAQESTPEYAALQAAKAETKEYQNTANALNAEKSAKEAVLAEKKAEVENIKATYLKELEEAEAEARQDMVNAVKKQIGALSDDVNQVEFDKALNEWANEAVSRYNNIGWSWDLGDVIDQIVNNYNDAKDLRKEMDRLYNTGKLREIFNRYGLSQWAVGTGKTEEVMDAAIKAYREGLRQCEEKQANMEAKIAALNAADAKLAGQDAIDEIGTIKDLTSAERIEAAKDKVDAAESTLEEVKKEAQEFYKLNSIDLQELLNKIAVAEQAVADAKATLDEITVIKRDIRRYSGYANSYADYVDGKAQKGTAFVRIATETVNGKTVPILDEEGKFIYLEENSDYDLTNEGVISRPTDRFTNISDKLKLEVPESIYKAYLKAILSFEKGELTVPVKGIATGSGSDTESNATMPIIYWVVGKDGKLTGDYYTSTTDMPTGKYFVGYTFKTENDGYHLDGIMVNFEREEGGNEDGVNGGGTTDGGTTGGSTTSGGTTGGGTTTIATTVTINDAGVPLAAGLDGVVIDDGEVPLAAGLDEVVIDEDGVPLADSIPQTGDNAVPAAPVAATGITALLAAFFMGKRKKED